MSGNRFFPRSRSRTQEVEVSKGPKTTRHMERHLKGVANHRRIEILLLISNNERISVEGIAEATSCNFKTISEHIRRLVQAGLVDKKYKGRLVTHTLSPYGRVINKFITTFQHS